jgi:serine/threonine protein kinase
MDTTIVITIVAIIGGLLVCVGLYFLVRYVRAQVNKRKQIHARQVFAQTHTCHIRGNFVQQYSHTTRSISDDYELFLDQELGRGGCGCVVVGEAIRNDNHNNPNGAYANTHPSGVNPFTDTQTTEQFAIKIVDKQSMERGRIDREISLLKDVDHPNIIRLFSVYDTPKRVYLVMELCAGGHLGHLLNRQMPNKHLDEAWARLLTRQLASAIAHLHTRGIAHRDIKLQNILIDSTNDRNAQIKLIDFGYSARFVGNLPMKTKCGTPYTTAPEVLRESYDERCDVWSCGVCVYIMLCGKCGRVRVNERCS